MANIQQGETNMLEKFFSAPKTLRRLRGGISGPHIDAFADDLERDGYASASALRYLRAASHLGCFVQRQGGVLSNIDRNMLDSFSGHLCRCRCPHFKRGKLNYHAHFGVKLFHHHLVGHGICRNESVRNLTSPPALVTAFCDWFRTHRGVKEPTLRHYARGATDLLRTLGEDVGQWKAQALRDYLLEQARQGGMSTTQKLITSLRAFLRFLNFRGECRDDLTLAIPAVAHWRLARLPRCLSAEEVDRLIAACNGTNPGRLRDRAIILMLARLGLRSGDVAVLRLSDIDWSSGTLQVMGKGRYQVRLPLPQDVGDALLRYLECRPTNVETDHVFIRSIAPRRPFASGDGVSSVVRQALKRVHIDVPSKGAHLLRHTAATEMLRNGVPLEQAGLVLRHRSIDMTAYYAKADIALLQQIAQPWPEVKG
jgi:site-specific recombinase XerD